MPMKMLKILFRTAILYVFLNVIIRFMGKRQIGELEVSDMITTLLFSELIAIPISEVDLPLMSGIVPILFIFICEFFISRFKNKNQKLKTVLEGRPRYIIYKGRLLQKRLYENRISVNELLSELRTQGIGSIDEVEYAILEQCGSLSVMKKGESMLGHTIIIDGKIIVETVSKMGYNKAWVEKRLAEERVHLKDVLLMTVDDTGKIDIIRKDGSF